MFPETQINDIQAGIMRQLFLHERLRFAEINVDHVPSDQFSYHLRQLLKYGLIVKDPEGAYSLSVMGRSRAIMLYPDKNSFIEQGFLAVRVVLTRQKGAQEYVLVQERLLVPYQGSYGIPGDKVLFGEDVADAAVRAMRQQAGLECAVQLAGLQHYKDRYLDRIVQDKYFFVFSATQVAGQLAETGMKGNRNLWMAKSELESSPKTLHGVSDMLHMARTGHWKIDEQTVDVMSY